MAEVLSSVRTAVLAETSVIFPVSEVGSVSSVSQSLPKVATFFSDDFGIPRTKDLSESRSLEKRENLMALGPSPGWKEDRIKA